jgi:hypothetical protein
MKKFSKRKLPEAFVRATLSKIYTSKMMLSLSYGRLRQREQMEHGIMSASARTVILGGKRG